jgi:hypothetical protein
MPSARIITRSQVCARELALDLLSRGYCVEIVSPDRIPNNFADLELRVDSGPDGELISNIEAHNGKRSTSLDLVHHLKTPMEDFVRKPVDRVARIAEAANFAAEPSVERIGDKKLLALPEIVPAKPIAPALTVSTAIRPSTISRQHERARRGFWSASFTFAGIVLLALLLWVGIRQSGKAAQLPRGTRSEKVVPVSASVNSVSANDSAENNSYQNGLANSHTSAAPPEVSGVSAPVSHLHDDDYVARDTVIYLDKRTADEAAAKANRAKRQTRRSTVIRTAGDGVIAANSVTYLNAKPTAKAEKQNSVEASGSNLK